MFLLCSNLRFFQFILHISTLWYQYITHYALVSHKHIHAPFYYSFIDDTKVLAGRLQFGFIFRIITPVSTLSLLYCKVYLVKFFLTTRTQAVYMTCISEKYTNRLSRNLYEGLVNYHLTPSRTELFL